MNNEFKGDRIEPTTERVRTPRRLHRSRDASKYGAIAELAVNRLIGDGSNNVSNVTIRITDNSRGLLAVATGKVFAYVDEYDHD